MTAHRPVRLPSAAVSALGVREWGIPTGHFVGAAWHRPSAGTVSCIVPGSRGTVVVQTRALRVVDDPANAWVPAHWRRAAALSAGYALREPGALLLPLVDGVGRLDLP